MKKKEVQELKSKSSADLQKKIGELRDRLHGLKMDLAAGKVKNVREINVVKKDIARMLTAISTNQ